MQSNFGGSDMAKIVIDPGHGGSATIPGDSTWNNAVGPGGTLEKTLTLDIGRQVHAILQAAGHTVKLTRSTDVNLRLRDRAAVARAISADAFVSIHFNGSTGHNAQGTETLVHTSFSPKSARLSLAVQDAVLPVTGLTDRNSTFNPATRIKPQALGVLKPASHAASTAGCLVEVSFLDRAAEEDRLRDAAYRAAIARAIADGIDNYLGAGGLVADVEFGDAIEAVAATVSDEPDPVSFLALDAAPDFPAPARDNHTDEPNEAERIPRAPFARAFVEGAMDAGFLMPEAAPAADARDFSNFINGLNLRHFAPDEFLVMGGSNASGRCAGRNTFPPRELWPNIANTAIMLDEIRERMGASIRTLSCYRSPAYNTCIGGESASLHMRFNAIDFTCSAGTPEIWRRVASAIRASDRRFLGGIGVYPSSRFVHIDTRGREANWRG